MAQHREHTSQWGTRLRAYIQGARVALCTLRRYMAVAQAPFALLYAPKVLWSGVTGEPLIILALTRRSRRLSALTWLTAHGANRYYKQMVNSHNNIMKHTHTM